MKIEILLHPTHHNQVGFHLAPLFGGHPPVELKEIFSRCSLDRIWTANSLKGVQKDFVLLHSFEGEDELDLLHLQVRQQRTSTRV